MNLTKTERKQIAFDVKQLFCIATDLLVRIDKKWKGKTIITLINELDCIVYEEDTDI